MPSLNKVLLIGNLGSNPELSYLDEKAFIVFRLATNRKYKDKDGKLQTDTQWHTVKCWGKMAETANKYLKKGQLIYLEGRLESRSYEDKDGRERFFTDIIVNEFLMLGKNERKEEQKEQKEQKEKKEEKDEQNITL